MDPVVGGEKRDRRKHVNVRFFLRRKPEKEGEPSGR